MSSYKEYKKRALQNPEVKAEYDALQPEYDIIQARVSEEVYNNLMENIHVMGNKDNYDWLMESKAQLENGNFASHTLVETAEGER